MKVLVDADSLVYLVGFAGQTSDYNVTILEKRDGETLLVDMLTVHGLDEVGAIESQLQEGQWIEKEHFVTEEPLAHTLASCKRSLLAIRDAIYLEHKIPVTSFDLYLTGTGNHRDDYAQVRGYKANRIGTPRPVHYAAIRKYLIDTWNATVVDGCEADDIVSILAAGYEYDPDKVMIVSCDKDLTTVPGRLYNFRRRTMRVLTANEARLNFYRQMIVGDPTDNVIGVYGFGKKYAETAITASMDETQMAQAVYEAFERSLSRVGCPYADRSALDVMTETGILLHMQRKPGEIWTPPALGLEGE